MPPIDFVPPRCPVRTCPEHRQPGPRFFRRVGSYRPRCRSYSIPRFECRSCGKGFSYQTFRMDYRDRRPELNAPLFSMLVSSTTLRQAARLLEIDCTSVQRKFRKMARHLAIQNRSLLPRLPAGRTLCLDEIETYEAKSIHPVTVAIVVDKQSKAIVAVDVAPIRRATRKGSHRRRWMESDEAKCGRREDRGRNCVRRIFGRMERLLEGRSARLVTDRKSSYAVEARSRFARTVEHVTVSSRRRRDTRNRLFAVNLTAAMSRDNNGRLRRSTWAVSKRRHVLALQLELFVAYRNWHRQRTNRDPRSLTPAVALGMASRRLEIPELLAWRQDWRDASIHPSSTRGDSAIGEGVF